MTNADFESMVEAILEASARADASNLMEAFSEVLRRRGQEPVGAMSGYDYERAAILVEEARRKVMPYPWTR